MSNTARALRPPTELWCGRCFSHFDTRIKDGVWVYFHTCTWTENNYGYHKNHGQESE